MAAAAATTTVPEGILFGMGNPLLDISAGVDQAFLDKYGIKVNNAILCEEKQKPIYAELMGKKDVEFIAGGAAQNTIRVTQWMLQSPGATGYTGAVANDDYAKLQRAAAAKDGVTLHYMTITEKDVPTGTCACCILGKERSLVANLAAANHFALSHLESEALKAVIAKAKFFYVEGYFLTSGFSSIMHVAKQSHATDKTFCLNLSAPFLPEFFTSQLMEAMPYVDFLFGNESEALAHAKKQGFTDLSLSAIALKISEHTKVNTKRPRTVVITNGSESTVVAYDGKVTTYAVPKLDSKLIVDTNGAGDAFCGGFMSKLVQGKDTKTCVDAGHYAAQTILQVSGTVLPATKPTL